VGRLPVAGRAQTHVGPGLTTGPYVRGGSGLPPSTGFRKRIRAFGKNPLVGGWDPGEMQTCR
jgi:hypothetical protein